MLRGSERGPAGSPGTVLALLLLLTVAGGAGAGAAVIDYVPSAGAGEGAILDVRAEAACRRGSLPGARCLPVTEFVGPHKRLANVSGMLWLLGSAGLTGEEHLLVIGDRPEEKELMAGLLYLAGQRRISVLEPSSQAWAGATGLEPGRIRSKTRETVYTAPMRDDRVVLRGELVRVIDSGKPPPLMDGRSESEYWGQRVRGMRGGHLPGARWMPVVTPSGDGRELEIREFDGANPWIVYGHDAAEGLTYLARLVAMGVEPRLYLEGWAGWASDGALPVDSLTYRDLPVQGRRTLVDEGARLSPTSVLGIAVAGFVLAVGGFFIGRVTLR